jgi:hypothetical protein
LAGPLLAGAVTAFAAAQYAIGRPVAPEAWLAVAPLLASLALRPPRTALLAGWTVLLGLGLALDVSGPPGRLASSLAVLALPDALTCSPPCSPPCWVPLPSGSSTRPARS